MLVGAIEAGGTKFICGVGTEQGEILEQISIPTRGPEETLKDVVDFFKGKEIERLGIGSFGPIQVNKTQPDYGSLLETPKTIWKHYPLLKHLEGHFPAGMPIVVDTDVNAAVLGEIKWGAAKGKDSCVYFTVGTGIGAGVFLNGKLLHGLMHPEAGHMFIKRHEMDDFSGCCPYHKDCLEGLASGTALKTRWGVDGTELTDDRAWELEGYYLAQAAVNAIVTYSPEKIIFGGGVSQRPGLIEQIQKQTLELLNGYIKKNQITDNIEDYISLPGLGSQAGLKGSLALVLD
ncbi:ROK family protein [Oceanobacillus jordanicus]|uniref:fructokinase n=1 Tax=Oceanobacillus jordanicus TaxID=2867266 RepID=A0AAW5B4J5_9BACI|nr:ROK family protein [Oceanobacillus jordanicus]MCG3419454.1 ROK family protein [Oceanobacillus jordanicus]